MVEHDIELPGRESLTFIDEAALTSRDLDFIASMTRPTQALINEHFAAFAFSCAEPAIESEAA